MKASLLRVEGVVGGGVAGGDKGDLGLLLDLGEGDREPGLLSIAGLDGGLAGIRRRAAELVSVSFVSSHVGCARSGCGWSLSPLEGPGVGGLSKSIS